ncbi:MAG TPA: hypothetical protein VN775_04075 [Opitutaceae bacterium]|nr:hypothetical protein [Opitutaceae bacterium]
MSGTGASRALWVGVAGTAATALGLLVSDKHVVATSWLVGFGFWAAMAIGMLMMIVIWHVFDSSWSVVLRRQFEHGLAAFPWLALLLLPLILASYFGPGDLVWPWMNPLHQIHGGRTVRTDLLYEKKEAFLNLPLFTILSLGFFAVWIWISARLRKASFTQDTDGDVRWTHKNRFTSGFGIPVVALTLTAAAIYWFKSLEYHWFSTMYGVWYFSDCMRGALSLGVIIMLWLYGRGDFRQILKTDHLWAIGQLMLTFTVFWAYISFDQYFLIWNANVPEETFWYNIREYGDWWYVSLFLVFGNFLLPFLLLLSYRYKVTHATIRRIAYMILFVIFVDIAYNILPALKDEKGNPLAFFSLRLVWSLTSLAGVGGFCIAAYLRSLPTTKLIPIRDPRIAECLSHDE